MRKFLLILSAICFFAAIVVYWFSGVWAGVIATVLIGALIALDIYLIKNNARWWITLVIFFVSFMIMTSSFSNLFARNIAEKVECSSKTESTVEEKEDEVLLEEESIEEPEDVEEISYEEDIVVPASKPVSEPKVVTKTEYVEKVVEKRVEVPVEKEVIKEVVVEKEVPVVEYVEVEKKPEVSTPVQTPTPTPNYNYNSQYYGDPTGNSNYGYGYNNGYYGDPTGNYYGNNSSVNIKGKTTVTAGNSYTYTISGVSSISKSKLDVPSNVNIERVSGNKVTLYFEEDWTGSYSIGYGSAAIKIKVTADE